MSESRILITGGNGQLGSDLRGLLGQQAVSFSHKELDITDAASLGREFESVNPTAVINCAAYHNVDLCEQEVQQAWTVNFNAVKNLAQLCEKHNSTFVHISTNYVFDGTLERPYREDDLPSPRSVYATSKLAGEFAARTYAAKALVVRTAGLYGFHGSESKGGNFIERVINRANETGSLQMVSDQRLTPTFTKDLAAGIIEAVDQNVTGLLHLTNTEECSWFEFTEAILDLANIDSVPINPVKTTPKEGVANRPLNGVLDSRAKSLGLSELRPWHEALVDYMRNRN